MEQPSSSHIIEIGEAIGGSPQPQPRKLRPTRPSDYPHVPAVYIEVAQKLASPLLMGPPLCDELVAMVQHLLTEEEAGVVRHLGMLSGRSAATLARAERRPLDQIEPILQRLSEEKRVIARSGEEQKSRYRLVPIMPGIFEMVLMRPSLDTLTDWHRRFAELFEALYETGYVEDYRGSTTPLVRFLPVGKAIEAHPMALPADQLELVLDQFEDFAVGQCQCRIAMDAVGRGCGKPKGNCAAMGRWARKAVENGLFRAVGKREMLDIKREAEAHGMVNWFINVAGTKSQCSCSCCGCCCHAMRGISEHNVPGMIAPPHFVPRFDPARCAYCLKCAGVCPMRAIVVDREARSWRHRRERCVGCGLCAVACEQKKAIAMEAVPDWQLPYKSWFAMLSRAVPQMLATSWRVWRQRR